MGEIKNTFGIINSDYDPQFIKDGDYQYAINIRNSGSTGSQTGVIEPIRGSEKKEINLPSGTNKCIGHFSHDETNSVYYFIFNAAQNPVHSIIRYDYGADVLEFILQTVELKFTSENYIVESNIIGDQLFFNDAKNEVKRIDLAETKLFTEDEIWEFTATIAPNPFGEVALTNTNGDQVPFSVGDQIFVIRDWREAWIDSYDTQAQGSGTISIQSIVGDGYVQTIQIEGVGQILFNVSYGVGGEEQLAQDIADAINNHTASSGPDFTAYVNPEDPLQVIIVAPVGTPSSYEGTQILVNTGGGPPFPTAFIYGGNITGVMEDASSGCNTAIYHDYDPNPAYSGIHTVLEVGGSTMILSAEPTGVQDHLLYDGEFSFIGGRAYLHKANRKFNLPFREKFIKLYRENPPYAAFCRYDSDQSKKANNLRGSLYQFKTRYVYPNGMRSVPSPISKIPIPLFEQNIAFQFTEVWRDNHIQIWFDTGGKDVVAVELLARESSNPVDQDWSLVRSFDKEEMDIISNTSHKYNFYGDELRIRLPVAEGIQPMDYIPHVGHAFCFIRDKRNAIGGCEEGFDNYELSTTVEPVNCSEVSSRAVIIHKRWPNDGNGLNFGDITDANLPPITQDILFPLNKYHQVDDSGFVGGQAGPGGDLWFNPFWRYKKTGNPENQFNFGDFPLWNLNFWEWSTDNPQVTGYVPLDASVGFDTRNFFADRPTSYPWTPMVFVFYKAPNSAFLPLSPGNPSYGDAPVGSIFIVSVRFRVSKALVWCDRVPGGTLMPDQSNVQIDYDQGGFEILPGILGFETLDSSNQDGFYYFSETFTKLVDVNDTPASIRNYFAEKINNSQILNTQITVEFARFFSPQSQGDVQEVTVNVGVQASTTSGGVGQPTDWPFPEGNVATATPSPYDNDASAPLWVRPVVTVEPVSNDAFGTFMNLETMRFIYAKIGANQLRITSNVVDVGGYSGFKTGAKHRLAVEYRDEVGRRWTVSPSEITYVPYFNEPNGVGRYGVNLLARINSLAPIGATHYQFMYSGNLTMANWIQFEVNWVAFDNDSDVIKIALSPRLNRYNTAVNAGDATNLSDINGRSDVSYSWSRGDRLRFITYWTGSQGNEPNSNESEDNPATEFVDVEVIGEATDNELGLVIMVNKLSILPYIGNESFGSGSLIEVYTPKENVTDSQLLYSEIGETFRVSPTRNHYGNRLNQGEGTPGSNNPYAEVIIKSGDAYVIGRSKLPEAGVNRSKPRVVESPWFTDFYPSETWGGGAVNRYNPDAKRLLRKDIIRYSDFLLEDRNGLNRYFDGNINDEPDVLHGLIQRMECPDRNLYVFQELSTGIQSVRAAELLTASGETVLMRSDNVLGQIQYVPGGFGIGDHRESLSYYVGVFYFACVSKGLFLRLSGAQAEAISKSGKDNFFNEVFERISQRNSSTTRVIILSAFDPKYGELVVHIPLFVISLNGPDGVDIFDGTTIGYSEAKKGWVTQYSFSPESIGHHRNKLVSWKQGQLYVHDKTEQWNDFYDGEEAVDSKITLVFNEKPQAIKFLQSIGFMYGDLPVEPKEVVISTPYGAGQKTSLFSSDFEYSESQFFAAVLQNELTPDVDNPILEGDDMRGNYFIVEVTFGTESKFELFAVSLDHKESEMSIKRT